MKTPSLRSHRRLTAAALAMALMGSLFPMNAKAATATTTMNVSLTITAGCTVTATAMNFGTAQLLTSNVDATATVSPTCTKTTPYTIALDAGSGSGATVASRLMTGPGAATVAYSLYQDSARGTLWGITGGALIAGTGAGVAQPINVYGRVPVQSSANVVPGTYADVVNVTVAY